MPSPLAHNHPLETWKSECLTCEKGWLCAWGVAEGCPKEEAL
jgi:hypothetical protein